MRIKALREAGLRAEHLGDSSSGILVPQDVAERVVGDDGDQVLLEVVS
jgi:hypothetical protein